MRKIKLRRVSAKGTIAAIAILAAVLAFACQPARNANSNVNANANSNANSATSNDNFNAGSDSAGLSINTREPDKYSATLIFSIVTEGGDNLNWPHDAELLDLRLQRRSLHAESGGGTGDRITARSRMFSSSRMLPGQE